MCTNTWRYREHWTCYTLYFPTSIYHHHGIFPYNYSSDWTIGEVIGADAEVSVKLKKKKKKHFPINTVSSCQHNFPQSSWHCSRCLCYDLHVESDFSISHNHLFYPSVGLHRKDDNSFPVLTCQQPRGTHNKLRNKGRRRLAIFIPELLFIFDNYIHSQRGRFLCALTCFANSMNCIAWKDISLISRLMIL